LIGNAQPGPPKAGHAHVTILSIHGSSLSHRGIFSRNRVEGQTIHRSWPACIWQTWQPPLVRGTLRERATDGAGYPMLLTRSSSLGVFCFARFQNASLSSSSSPATDDCRLMATESHARPRGWAGQAWPLDNLEAAEIRVTTRVTSRVTTTRPAQETLALHGSALQDRPLHISRAKPDHTKVGRLRASPRRLTRPLETTLGWTGTMGEGGRLRLSTGSPSGVLFHGWQRSARHILAW